MSKSELQKFSFDTVKDFDNHISSSILGYDLLHSLILNISTFFIKDNCTIVDLGCTSGKLINTIKHNHKRVNAIGYDITDSNFEIDVWGSPKGEAILIKKDISDSSFEIPLSNIIYSIFTLQFIDIRKRGDIIKKIYNSLVPGGIFIFCEKEYSNNGVIQECFTFTNYDNKLNNFTAIEILRKEKDLRTIMHPLTSGDNYKMLNEGGFKNIDTFFQSLGFKGYICTK